MDVSDVLRYLRKGENEYVEFKKKVTRDFGEEICALANADGGIIFVGVDDYGNIIGCDAKKDKEKITSIILNITPPPKVAFDTVRLNDKEILIVKIEKSKNLCTIGGIAYIRVGTSKRPLSLPEIVALGAEYAITPIDSHPTDVPASNISSELWNEFLRKRAERGYIHTGKDLKRKLGIVRNKNGKSYLTLAGLLFFYETPQEFLPHTYVRVNTPEGWIRVDGAVWKIPEKIINIYLKYAPKKYEFIGIERKDMYHIPIRALREAIVNALVHRNYTIYSEVFVYILPHKVTVKNPGSFPPGTSPEDPKPIPRNPTLYELMFEVGLVERQGSGIEMMKNLCKQSNINLKIVSKGMFTTVEFECSITQILDETEKKILEILEEKELSSSEIAEIINVSKPTVLKKIHKLQSLGLIESVGYGPKRRYRKLS